MSAALGCNHFAPDRQGYGDRRRFRRGLGHPRIPCRVQYKAASGERVWRHWTVPSKGEPGYDTWKGNAVTYGGGATWLTGSYDPDTDTLYWATGNPYPDSGFRRSRARRR